MKIFKKVFAITMALLILATFTINVFASEDTASVFDRPDTLTEGGDKENGYTLKGAKNTVAAFKEALDIKTQSIQLKTEVPGQWDFIAFTNSATRLTGFNVATEKETQDAVTFRLANIGDVALAIYPYTGAKSDLLKKIEPFDFTVAHTYGLKFESEKWWLVVDGVAVADLTTNDDPIVTTRLNKLSESGTAYVQMASYEGDADFSAIKIIGEKSSSGNTNTGTAVFDRPDTLTEGGDKENGYTLKGAKNTVAAFKEALDIKTQSIQLKTEVPGQWDFIAFTNSATRLTGFNVATEKETQDAVTFRLANIGDVALAIYPYTGAKSDLLKKIEPFDFTVAHTYGLKFESEKWWLVVDGVAVADLTTNDDPIVTTRLNKLSESGTVYVQLASYEGNADFSAIKIIGEKKNEGDGGGNNGDQGGNGNDGGNKGDQAIDDTGFELPDTMSYSGNENDGYTLTGSKSTVAALKKAINIKEQSIQYKSGFTGSWDFLAFTNSNTKLPGVFGINSEKVSQDAVIFRLVNIGDTALAIYNFSGSATNLLTKIEGFNFGIAHTYGFKNAGGKWWLTVDGISVVDLSTNDDAVVAERLNKLSESGKAYVQFASYEGNADFSAIKLVKNATSSSGNSVNNGESSDDDEDWFFDWDPNSGSSDSFFPATGDNSTITIAIVAMLVSATIVVLVIAKFSKKEVIPNKSNY